MNLTQTQKLYILYQKLYLADQNEESLYYILNDNEYNEIRNSEADGLHSQMIAMKLYKDYAL